MRRFFLLLLLACLTLPGPALARGGGSGEGQGEGLWQLDPLLNAPLSRLEEVTLAGVYRQVRPASFLISDCQVTRCRAEQGRGTGFFIGSDGTALTAYHVVFQARHLTVTLSDGRQYAARVIGYDDQRDLAVLKVSVPRGRPYLTLSSQRANPADAVLTVGNGAGGFLKSKMGRVLAVETRALRADFAGDTMQLGIPVQGGDSGGPVVNRLGQVVGVLSYQSLEGSGQVSRTLGYALPLLAGDLQLAQLRRGLKRDAPSLGVGLYGPLGLLADLSAGSFVATTQAQGLKLGRMPGAFFNVVTPGGPAARAGLKGVNYRGLGDLIIAVDERRVTNFNELMQAVREHKPGDSVTLTVLRAGKTLKVKVKLVGRASVNH